jgi:transposase-like protein
MFKKCPKCSSYHIKRYWTQFWSQRFKCNLCWYVFQKKKRKLNPDVLYQEYLKGKQTYQQLADKYHVNIRTIQRYIDKAEIFKKKR